MGRRKPRSDSAVSKESQHPAQNRRLIVGRGKACDIYVNDPAASRRHCAVIINDGQVSIVDLGSKNGTYVGQRRIGCEKVQLKGGDVVTIGRTILLLPTASN